MIINIPEGVYGKEINDVEIIEYDIKDHDIEEIFGSDTSLLTMYVLGKNGVKVGNCGIRYWDRNDEKFIEENLKNFFIDWLGSINSNE